MIIAQKREERITKEGILSKISEYDIFRYILGQDFKIGVSFCNKLRGEDNESAIIRSYQGSLNMKDYGNSEYNGDCFHLWQKVYNCSFYECLEQIERIFSLNTPREKQIINWTQPIIKEFKLPLIQVVSRNPTNEELAYWNKRHLSWDDLKRDNIYFPKEIYRNKQRVLPSPYLTFCYWYKEGWKLYRPHGELGKNIPLNRRKWDSGIRFDVVENIESFNNCKRAFLATSKKDKMVIKKATGIQCIGNIQGENLAAINDDDMEYIKANSEEQYICGDADSPGRRFSQALCDEFGFKHVNPPNNMPKDFDEMGVEFGLESIYNHFLLKKLI